MASLAKPRTTGKDLQYGLLNSKSIASLMLRLYDNVNSTCDTSPRFEPVRCIRRALSLAAKEPVFI